MTVGLGYCKGVTHSFTVASSPYSLLPMGRYCMSVILVWVHMTKIDLGCGTGSLSKTSSPLDVTEGGITSGRCSEE